MGIRRFGLSTRLYHHLRLRREHLADIGAHGFETVEIVATRTHFDYWNEASVAELQEWLGAAGLELGSVHAPVAEGFAPAGWERPLSIASADPDARARAVAEVEQALYIARRIPYKALIVHLGRTSFTGHEHAGDQDSRDGARRSIEKLTALAAPLGVRIAVEVIPNELSRPGSLVHFVEAEIEGEAGICLDVGHAHLNGDVVDVIEIVSEHLVAVHLHDNRGRTDDHLMPFAGTIDWPAAMTTVQKVGFDGPLTLEVAPRRSAAETLAAAREARARLEKLVIW